MQNFSETLSRLIEDRFDGHQSSFALTAPRFDPGLLTRLLTGKRFPTVEAVAKLAAKLPRKDGDALIAAYLRDVAEHVNEARRSHR